jgi:UDP-N-acetylmuramoyl-L-alanyl-D-glutamate--2,6-diaminopimelate ligase
VFLSELLNGVRVTKLFEMQYGRTLVTQDIQISNVQYDSRKVHPGDMFVALRGTAMDGHAFIDNAVSNGAVVVVLEDDAARPDSFFLHANVAKVVVPNARQALARIAANYYGTPSTRLRPLGVTGTNGKTTTTHLLWSILQTAGEKAGLLGTINYLIGDDVLPASHTTPESLEMQELLARMVREGCTTAVMEVSSHALMQHRVDGLQFRAGVFTNLTQDHLDYHGTMESYRAAKKMLFDMLEPDAVAVINADDASGDAMVEGTRAHVLRYGIGTVADVHATDVRVTIHGTQCSIHHGGRTVPITSALTGRFNAANILAAFATGVALGLKDQDIVRGIERMQAVRGRFEQMASPAGWTAIIDYAHTPDALENCLRTIHDILPVQQRGKIITVFGCGGNRDAGKRPIMGRIAAVMSDEVIVTSDNPRKEDPEAIIRQIMAGVRGPARVRTEADRHRAIILGLESARAGDVVLIAGKGHEDYQVLGETRHHFDDREEVENFIRART